MGEGLESGEWLGELVQGTPGQRHKHMGRPQLSAACRCERTRQADQGAQAGAQGGDGGEGRRRPGQCNRGGPWDGCMRGLMQIGVSGCFLASSNQMVGLFTKTGAHREGPTRSFHGIPEQLCPNDSKSVGLTLPVSLQERTGSHHRSVQTRTLE